MGGLHRPRRQRGGRRLLRREPPERRAGRRPRRHLRVRLRVTPRGRRFLGELVGTAVLVAAIVGSGVAAARLSPGDVGLQLLENATATAAALVAIILTVGPVSGAHLNPVVTLVDLAVGGVRWRD